MLMDDYEEALKEKYKSASVGELLNILDHASEYTPVAIKVAQSEITRRRLDEEDIKIHRLQINAERRKRQQYSATEKLSTAQKAFFYFLWPLPTFLDYALKQNFKEDEAELKLQQAFLFKWAGIILLFLTTFMCLWLDLPTIIGVTTWAIGFFLSIAVDNKWNG